MKNIKESLLSLPLSRKIIVVSALLTSISVFLPWYKDFDFFKNGASYLGITGPLYLIGLLILVSAVLSALVSLASVFKYKVPDLKVKDEHFFIGASSISLLLVLIASSIYFHNKFGVNILDKEVGIGLIMAFLGTSLALVGGVMDLNKGRFQYIKKHADQMADLNISVEEAIKNNNE